MTLSEELSWRGFVNQTTYKKIQDIDGQSISFYWGVDPSADSMTIGNLAVAMMVRHFINYGHKAFLLVGGATGLIGDPDGKSDERQLKSLEAIDSNKKRIAEQYRSVFNDLNFEIVDNYDWFKELNYLTFLRDVGKHVPIRQMIGRDFVQSRINDEGPGISYAEFSYALIQAYDFLHLNQSHGVSLQVCGADQWGNCIAGVDLIRRVTGNEAHVWSSPLVVNKLTGVKFGKSEEGAIWLDEKKTSPFKFYQFWLNVDDEGVETYLKIYTLLTQSEIENTMKDFNANRRSRSAQKKLAFEVTKLVHGEESANIQTRISQAITGESKVSHLKSEDIAVLRSEIPFVKVTPEQDSSIISALHKAGLASSTSEARRLIAGNAVYIDNEPIHDKANFDSTDSTNLLLRRGKAYKDTALIEIELP